MLDAYDYANWFEKKRVIADIFVKRRKKKKRRKNDSKS